MTIFYFINSGKNVNILVHIQGKPISVTQLFSGEVQIEHIHPWSRSLNDSFSNKTFFIQMKIKKGIKHLFEFYGDDGANWSAIKKEH